jgi:hypothetical protein
MRTDPYPTSLQPETEVLFPEARRRERRRRLTMLATLLLFAVAATIGVTAVLGRPTARAGAPSIDGAAGVPSSTASGVSPRDPVSLAAAADGSLYIGDLGRQQILKRSPNGRFTVVAGTGVAVSPAMAAPPCMPRSMTRLI